MAKEDLVSYAVTVVRIMTRSFFDFHLSGFAFPAPGEFLEFLVGVCRPVLQILTRFQTKKCNFPHPFSDQNSKVLTRFHTWPLSRNTLSLLRLERKQKNSSNPFRILIFFFLSYSFGIETIKTFIQSRSSLKTHTRFQTKMGKVYGTVLAFESGHDNGS